MTHELDGVAVLLRRKDTLYPIFPAGDSDAIQWRFQDDRASFTVQGAFFSVKETVCVSGAHDGELRQFQVQLEEPGEERNLLDDRFIRLKRQVISDLNEHGEDLEIS